MLKISKLTDYAVVVMSRLASQPEQLLSASELSAKTNIAQPTVSKLLKLLAKAGLLESVCGAVGGYKLARPSQHISLVDIIMAIEGLPSLTVCCDSSGNCMHDTICTMKANWRQLNHFILKTLANLTLADMLRPLEQHPYIGQMIKAQRGVVDAVRA